MTSRPPARAPRHPLSPRRAGWLAALLLLPACGGGGVESEPSLEDALAREKAAALFEEIVQRDASRQPAWEAIAPLVERADPEPEDLLRAALIRLEDFKEREDADDVRRFLEGALAALPDSAAVHFNLGRLEMDVVEFEAAREHFRRARELAPGDFAAHLAYANVLNDLDEFETARPIYEDLVDGGWEVPDKWMVTTLFRYYRMLYAMGLDEEAERIGVRHARLDELGIEPPVRAEADRGFLGLFPGTEFPALPAPTPPPPTQLAAADLGETVELPAGVTGFAAVDLTEDWEHPFYDPDAEEEDEDRRTEFDCRLGTTDLVAWGPSGVFALERDEGGWRTTRAHDGPVDLLEPFDLGNDADLDFLVASGAELFLLERDEGSWSRSTLELPALPGPPSALLALDFDHEGDLDFLAVGDFGARLLRYDGADVKQGVTLAVRDATAESGLDPGRPVRWCVSEDFDADQDVDVLLGGAGGAWVASNLRGGAFELLNADLPAALADGRAPAAADVDRDGTCDLVLGGAQPVVFRGRRTGGFEAAPGAPGPGRALAGDRDLDGVADLVAGPDPETGVPLPGDFDAAPGDELALLVDGAVRLVPAAPAAARANGLRIALQGAKDNQRGVGAIVELRAGELYRRIYWRGEPRWIGVGDHETIDRLRITWPNGVVQNHVDVPARGCLAYSQKQGLVGSCPFLYTWNGTTYEFVSDVLGITPLGLPMAPGMLVPPDHDEFVLVTGEQLVPRALADGSRVLELQFTEELREVTYLDRVRLDVVDHPEGTEVFPNERFCFPPFPEHHLHTVEGALSPLRATGSDGRDWTAELAALDGELAAPFEARTGQLLGLATPHWLELSFDPEAVADAEGLRLLATGWLYWTDASVNMAIARVDGLDFVPPLIQVPDGEGGWRDAGPPVGFPAGKLKTMVVDLDGMLLRDDPRIRIFSTLRLYWDALRLAVDGDDAPTSVTALEPVHADLWERGFSQPIRRHGAFELEWFEWDFLAEQPRWNQHPGLYTRHGDVLPLLGAIDDRTVIMGSGDALTLRFDADALPPVPDGWRRDYLVFLDGWAKDRDPNTHEALYVEPLPFHGMSSYPYPEDERFPDTEEHRAWRLEWNTRPAKRWIEPLSAP